jgi:hypothetical protein
MAFEFAHSDFRRCVAQGVEGGADLLKELLTLRGQSKGFARPIEERCTELLLEGADLMTDRAVCHTELLGGLCDAQMAGGGLESA